MHITMQCFAKCAILYLVKIENDRGEVMSFKSCIVDINTPMPSRIIRQVFIPKVPSGRIIRR